MALSTTVKIGSSGRYENTPIPAKEMCKAVPFQINPTADGSILGGVVYLNRATVVGHGGSDVTIVDDSSTLVITP